MSYIRNKQPFTLELVDVTLHSFETFTGEGYGGGDVEIEVHWEDEKLTLTSKPNEVQK
jgi:hypothetical protein